ncbi:MAG: hypothetical protein QNK43_06305 [Amphritea sp.]|nr:hypothetical protein [Amphritea sp.]
MSLFSMKHSNSAYSADFVLYGATILVFVAFLLLTEQGMGSGWSSWFSRGRGWLAGPLLNMH